jgi:hypothetical protein
VHADTSSLQRTAHPQIKHEKMLTREAFLERINKQPAMGLLFAYYGSKAVDNERMADRLQLVPTVVDGEFDYSGVLETLGCLAYPYPERTAERLEAFALQRVQK